jgi:hypothetical protein
MFLNNIYLGHKYSPMFLRRVLIGNPEKLATQGIQAEEKQNKNTTQCVLDTTIRKQTQIT